MALYDHNVDEELMVDQSVSFSGVNNYAPSEQLEQEDVVDMVNRNIGLDGVNKPRPGFWHKARMPIDFPRVDVFRRLWNEAYLLGHYNGKWWRYHSNDNKLVELEGGPSFSHEKVAYSCTGDNGTVYFIANGELWKYQVDAKAGKEGAVEAKIVKIDMGAKVDARFKTGLTHAVYALNRLFVTSGNEVLVSDILNTGMWDSNNQIIKLDPVKTDVITGIALWQKQNLVIFRGNETWLCQIGGALSTANWQLSRISGNIGCCSHKSVCNVGNEVFFLSESGKGVYMVSQQTTSEQLGVSVPISLPIRGYINRINWNVADKAEAIAWGDYYILAAPLDESLLNNYLLIYNVVMQKWIGIWQSKDVHVTAMSLDTMEGKGSRLLVGTREGNILEVQPLEKSFFYDKKLKIERVVEADKVVETSKVVDEPFQSSFITRGFTWGQAVNQVTPYNFTAIIKNSENGITVDRYIDKSVQRDKYKILPDKKFAFPLSFPFDLDSNDGLNHNSFSLLSVGQCRELQLGFSGIGDWQMRGLTVSAFAGRPYTNR